LRLLIPASPRNTGMLDYLIRGGNLVDGTGEEPRQAHVGMSGDRIAYVGNRELPASEVIDVSGMIVSPGFIDTHGHSEFTLLADGRAEAKVSQGVTSEINGNCGLSAAPLSGEALSHREATLAELGIRERWSTFTEYFDILASKGIALNFATLCGHGNLRACVVGYGERAPSDGELARMKALFIEALGAGVRGLSTGLIYPPGMYATTEELVEIASVMSDAGGTRGVYASHMRDEGDGLLESVGEVLRIGRESGVAAHISHIKTSGERNWGKIDEVVAQVERARGTGQPVTCDRYPYVASSTDLDAVLPSWVFDGGVDSEVGRLSDPSTRKRLAAELASKEDHEWTKVWVSTVTKDDHKWMEGLSVSEIAGRMRKSPVEAVLDLLRDERTRVGAIFFSMNEENLRRFLGLPYAMVGSDSSVRGFSGPTVMGKPHPRAFGTFARFIGLYVREMGTVSLTEAVRRITSLPAATFSLGKRGVIREGYYADLAVFDYGKIGDCATFSDPYCRARGVSYVFVNGVPVVHGGEFTGLRPGRVLR
jgi:N-acyl-D-aspartate/D-glutamate deacylase